jgi:hypothetical protein
MTAGSIVDVVVAPGVGDGFEDMPKDQRALQ